MIHSAKSILKLIGQCVVIIIACALLGTLLMSAVYAIPTGAIVENAKESVQVFQAEGTYPNISAKWYSRLDNWTDSIILATSAYVGEESLLEKALKCHYYVAVADDTALNPVDSFALYFSGNTGAEYVAVPYARYWHGYLLLTKPLLCFFNYQTIRSINGVAQILLTVLVVALLWKRKLKAVIVPYLVAWAMLVPEANAASLQFSAIFYVYTVSIAILLFWFPKWKEPACFIRFFLGVGIATSFFDFLTYPLAAWGMPMIVYLMLKRPENVKAAVVDIIKFAIAWGVGYIGMWAGKWVAATILTDQNVILEGIRAVGGRTSNEGIPLWAMIQSNIDCMMANVFKYAVGAVILITIVCAIVKKRNVLPNVIPYGLVAISPFAWYLVASNHSGIHHWFTYKALVITVFALMCMFIYAMPEKDKMQKIENE